MVDKLWRHRRNTVFENSTEKQHNERKKSRHRNRYSVRKFQLQCLPTFMLIFVGLYVCDVCSRSSGIMDHNRITIDETYHILCITFVLLCSKAKVQKRVGCRRCRATTQDTHPNRMRYLCYSKVKWPWRRISISRGWMILAAIRIERCQGKHHKHMFSRNTQNVPEMGDRAI